MSSTSLTQAQVLQLTAVVACNPYRPFKRRAFTSILDSEEKHLRHSQELMDALRRCIAGLEG